MGPDSRVVLGNIFGNFYDLVRLEQRLNLPEHAIWLTRFLRTYKQFAIHS